MSPDQDSSSYSCNPSLVDPSSKGGCGLSWRNQRLRYRTKTSVRYADFSLSGDKETLTAPTRFYLDIWIPKKCILTGPSSLARPLLLSFPLTNALSSSYVPTFLKTETEYLVYSP